MVERGLRPSILVDLAKDRIRIHRVTLNALQNPEYILLIVNPIEKSLGIMRGEKDAPGAHKVRITGRACYELYSKALTQKFRQICTDWVETGRYHMIGTVVPDELVAKFSMDEAAFTGVGKVT